ncbi:hypothetical protein [Saccharomonospora cyanea]|uniref:Uncharacterized protein n=1 Tax=Saccharomonospora cyanea NA-134 TaxID=882082 RepID=H5XQP0_9PSEU|nr:hypothetical protein [Saccharomonospora cyanea]EHR60100.1 hypothetical protein SaccyDRAFT_1189 [Saccharomonospora cyanea NA-134]
MRVVRFPARPTRVADDIRAALTSLGRGDDVIGGVAVLGVTPPDSDLEVDAVLVLPHGVLIVVGVDLPDPAMTLTAPLNGEWKADGWPLVRHGTDAPEGATGQDHSNPGMTALALAGRFADRVHATDPTIGVGVVIAVGPYVETVEQPPEDLAGPVRVVYPTASSFLTATTALPTPPRPLTTEQARAVLRDLAPTATSLDDTALTAEGFAAPDTPEATAATDPNGPSAQPVPNSDTPPSSTPTPLSAPASPAGDRRRSFRRHTALASAVLLVVAAVVAIVVVSSQDAPTPASTEPATAETGGVRFNLVARDVATACEPHHAVGDVQSFLLDHGCVEVVRTSFRTTLEGRAVSVSVGAVTFPDAALAGEFERLARTPGTGVLTDVASETGRWTGAAPTFEDATYTTRRDGTTVRTVLAQTDSAAEDSAGDLAFRVAQAALDLPLR